MSTATLDKPTVTTGEIRKWLRDNRPELGVGTRGTISAEAIGIYWSNHTA